MSEQTDGKAPEVRFAGFTDEWIELPMVELLSFKNGYNASGEQYGRGKKFINVLDIIENDFITHDRIIGRVAISAEDFKKNEVTYGDILFQRSSETREEVGQANVYLDEHKSATFGGFVIRGKPISEFDSVFFNAMLKSAKARTEITSRSGGSTRYNIGQDSLEDALVTIAPDRSEQEKIATLWMSLDRMIGLHQRKHDKLVTLKQAMLQKMFPQDDATTPEIRFKGFEEEWKTKKLGDVATLINGRAYSQNELLNKGPYKVLRVGNFYTNDSWYFSDMELGEKYYANKGDLLYTWSASFGPHIWNGEKVIYHYHIWKVELSDELRREFALQLLEYDKQRILSTSSGSTMIHLTKEGMEAKEFVLPEPEEQERIGTYFSALDTLISKHATQLEKLKNIKSACLEKMFV